MGLLDDLRNTSKDNYNACVNVEFPEVGDTNKARILAEETIEVIKQILARRVKDGDIKKDKTAYFYEYTSTYESEIKISNNIDDERITLKGPTIAFSSWKAAKEYFVLIDDFLNTEGLYREWKLRSLSISAAFNKVGIKKKIPLTKQADIHVFLAELHRKLKEKWRTEICNRSVGNSNYIYVCEDYSLVVKVFCDSKGIVK